MIQRIQTVYLLIVVALFMAILFLPLSVIQSEDQFYTFDVTGLKTMLGEPELVYASWGLFILAAIIILLTFVTIFLFKKRLLQIRLSIYNALLMVGFYCLFFYFVYDLKAQMEIIHWGVKIALSFPLISIILTYLAIRNIAADEALVRSLNRLR